MGPVITIGRLILRGGLIAVALSIAWIASARWLSLALDHLFTVPARSVPASPLGWDGVNLLFGAGPASSLLDLEGPGPGYRPAAVLTVDPQQRLTVSMGARRLVLGDRAGVIAGGDGPAPAYRAEPGDFGALTVTHGWLSWPVFEWNFMTGPSPSWRRSVYYHLTWKKRSKARLDLLWRFEQGYRGPDGWDAPSGATDGATGLIRAQITPAPP
ncbi:MAG TPA: hypothetical protein VGL58_15775 [Caulobacteraceae bacterium]|jgi:hypothetical protein